MLSTAQSDIERSKLHFPGTTRETLDNHKMIHEQPTDHQDLLKSYAQQLTDDQDTDFQTTKIDEYKCCHLFLIIEIFLVSYRPRRASTSLPSIFQMNVNGLRLADTRVRGVCRILGFFFCISHGFEPAAMIC